MAEPVSVRLWRSLLAGLLSACCCAALSAETIGSLRSNYAQLGSSQKLVLEAFADPRVPGVTCYISRAANAGFAEAVGAAEPGDSAINCLQTGTIVLPAAVRDGTAQGESVFSQKTATAFNTMQVYRFYDAGRRVLIYLAVSELPTGRAPRNSISAVAVGDWP